MLKLSWLTSKWKYLPYLLIFLNIFLSSWQLLHGDIHYDVDVARDFLVMDDIARNHHLTFLGPRSGAIPGIFHGPAWFYVNLPIFIIGNGNPIIIGWFWFLLSIVFTIIIYLVAKKMFDPKIALLSILLLSFNSIINPSIGLKNFYNPYGAVFLFPLFFWLFFQYLNTSRIKYLISSLFLLGLIIQFQMAFGIPILILCLFYVLVHSFLKKRIHHLFSFFILLIPLSTFIIFDLKHNFLQMYALIQFFEQKSNLLSTLPTRLSGRINELFFNYFDFFVPGKNIITLICSVFSILGFIWVLKKTNSSNKKIYFLFLYFFGGFWFLSLFFSGEIGNYFWPFLPIMIIVFSSFYNFFNKKIFIFFFSLICLINLYTSILAIKDLKENILQRGPHSWAFNLFVAKKTYDDAKIDFGYFTFSPDRYAFQQRYAFLYAKKLYPKVESSPSTKKPLTYLIEVDPPKDRPDLNGTNWRISDVKIDRIPNQSFRFDFIKIEKYLLNNEEIKVQPNPYLLDNVFIR